MRSELVIFNRIFKKTINFKVTKSLDASIIKTMLASANGYSLFRDSVQLNILNTLNTATISILPANQQPASFVNIY